MFTRTTVVSALLLGTLIAGGTAVMTAGAAAAVALPSATAVTAPQGNPDANGIAAAVNSDPDGTRITGLPPGGVAASPDGTRIWW